MKSLILMALAIDVCKGLELPGGELKTNSAGMFGDPEAQTCYNNLFGDGMVTSGPWHLA